MKCPHCGEVIEDELIRSEGARLMVANRPDRKKQKAKHAATRNKIRSLMDQLQELQKDYDRPNSKPAAKRAAKVK